MCRSEHLSSDFIVKQVYEVEVVAVILYVRLKELKATEPARLGFEPRSVSL